MRSTVGLLSPSAHHRPAIETLHFFPESFPVKKAEKWVKNLENGKKVVNLQCK